MRKVHNPTAIKTITALPPRWQAYRDLFAAVQIAKRWSRAQLVDALNQDALGKAKPKCTYCVRDTQYWEADPDKGRSSTPRAYRFEHLYEWLKLQVTDPKYAEHLKAIAPNTAATEATRPIVLHSDVTRETPNQFTSITQASKSDLDMYESMATEWTSSLLPCLIDSSYLQSAGRCITSQASSKTDVANFLRFLGEVVSRREVAIILAESGPVYPHSKPIVDRVNQLTGRQTIKVIPGETLDYPAIVKSVSPRILENLSRWVGHTPSLEAHSDITPLGGVDLEFHEAISSRRKSKSQWSLGNVGAKYLAPHLLTHPQIWKELCYQISVNERAWVESDTLRLCSAVRAECYFELARELGYSYQPSLARYALVTRSGPQHAISKIIGSGIAQEDNYYRNLKESEPVINALIILGQSEPKTILSTAAKLSLEITPLREQLADTSSLRGDAWGYYKLAQQAALVPELKKTFRRLVDLSTEGFSLNMISGKSDGSYTSERDTHTSSFGDLVTPLAVPVLFAAGAEDAASNNPYELFIQKCGIR